MKIALHHLSRSAPRRCQKGTAVIVLLALIAILLVYLAGNVRTLYILHREIKLVDLQQTRRLEAAVPRTNSVAGTNVTLRLINNSRPTAAVKEGKSR